MSQQEFLELALEEWGEHSWVRALLNTVTGSKGSAQFRFVARPVGDHRDLAQDVVVGATFPVMRGQDLDNAPEPNAWLETMRDRLQEIDGELVALRWNRAEQQGTHWWSYRYTRSEPRLTERES